MACTKTEKIYAPQITGITISGITPPSASSPTLSTQTDITLTYPYTSPTNTLVLRAPELRNNHMLSIRRINRETRGKTLIIFRDETWGTFTIHKLAFTALTKAKIDLLTTFLNQSLGKEIGYLDYENRQWRGYILNPQDTMSEETRDCGYSAQIDFRGRLV